MIKPYFKTILLEGYLSGRGVNVHCVPPGIYALAITPSWQSPLWPPIYIHIYTYIDGKRERERERERGGAGGDASGKYQTQIMLFCIWTKNKEVLNKYIFLSIF